jgi:dGTPase
MQLLERQQYECEERERLAPWAAHAYASQGRKIQTADDPFRTIFQRDRDRIIHSSAFRRLEYKTQVFVNHEGDYYRTRLTHSLEVSQISRAICRSLRLNEDLAEAIALAHDLGHTPFGHAGEEAMHEVMEQHGGFEHNYQSYRVVTTLENRYPQFSGLNLSFEVLEGIVKHAGEYDAPRGVADFPHHGYPTLEAQIVNLADEIAYTNHDLDDGLQSGMLTFDLLAHIPIWQSLFLQAKTHYPDASEKLLKHHTIRTLMGQSIHDVLQETTQRLTDRKIQALVDIREHGDQLAAFSPTFDQQLRELKTHLFGHLYRHYRVVRMADKAKRVVRELFAAFSKNPKMLPTEYFERCEVDGNTARPICDYIAGMTDRFALDEHRRLFDPHAIV